MQNHRYDAVLFDLDGTLTNTLTDIANAMNHTLREHGLPTWETDAYRYLVGNGPVRLTERAVRDRQELVPSVLKMYSAWYSAHNNITTAPYPGIPELLAELQRRGIPLCVFSNKADVDTNRIVAQYFPEIRFAAVQGSAPGLPMKPDPAGALAIAAKLGLQPSCFAYFGDTDVDMRCAVRAGMHPFGVLWGFRDEEELTAGGAEALLHQPLDFLSFI